MTMIGDSSLDVYPLCLGGNTFGWTTDWSQSYRVLDEYFEAGGNFVDTADAYSAWATGNQGGESETILGEWLAARGNREQIVLATKVGKFPGLQGLEATTIARAAEESLRRLQTDYIDLYYAHAEDLTVPIEESVEAFEKLREAGKIRQIGLSNHSPERIEEWMMMADRLGVARPIALQPHYNLLKRQEYEVRLRPLAERFDLGVMPYYSLAAGLLTGKYETADQVAGDRVRMVKSYLRATPDDVFAAVRTVRQVAEAHNVEPSAIAIAWLLHQPTITAPIASARTPAQLAPLLEGVSVVLAEPELAALNQATTTL